MKEEKNKINYKELLKEMREKIENEISFFDQEIKKIRTQRATTELIENLKVQMFGQTYLIKQLGSISISGPRELFISPWDPSYVEPILDEIKKSDLGFNAVADQKGVKISFPPLTEEFKNNLLKLISQKKEILRKKIRNIKEKYWNRIQEGEREKMLSQEEKFRAKKEIQEIIDEFQEKIDSIAQKKEKEILE